MYISFSGYDLYLQCPFAYWNRYVNKTTPPTPDNCVNSLYGSSVGLLFEWFYRDRVWKKPDYCEYLTSQAECALDAAIKDKKRGGSIVRWADEKANYHDRESLLADIRDTVPRGLRTIKAHRFLGPVADAEVKLDFKYDGHVIGGRADFIIHRTPPQKDRIILDGKGSKWKDLYVKDTQLKWYALLYRDHHGTAPDAIGFVFWKFEPEESVKWIPFTDRDLDVLRDEIIATLNRISSSVDRIQKIPEGSKTRVDLRQEYFPAQPSQKCSLCSYVEVCEDGKKAVKAKSNERRKRPVVLPASTGVMDIGFDDEG